MSKTKIFSLPKNAQAANAEELARAAGGTDGRLCKTPGVRYQAEHPSTGQDNLEKVNTGFVPQSFQNLKRRKVKGKTFVSEGLGRNYGDLATEENEGKEEACCADGN